MLTENVIETWAKEEYRDKQVTSTMDHGHAKDCEWHFEQYSFECTCGRSEAERRAIAVCGSWDAPGFEAYVQAEMSKLRATE